VDRGDDALARPVTTRAADARRVAVVGAGWAGLAAAVRAVQQGHRVTVHEMARHAGGRARSVSVDGLTLDNGQHILIGAYTHTLALLREVGVATDALLLRYPLRLHYPNGQGLEMPPGQPLWSFIRAVLGARGWEWRDRLSLLREAMSWQRYGFTCAPSLSVHELCRRLSPRIVNELIEPLCIAALNTPARIASARVFLRVLQDALFAGPGSADLMLPRVPLSQLLPEPAARWLASAGADLRPGHRVEAIAAQAGDWLVDGDVYDGVVLACSAAEAARLVRPVNADWSDRAAALRYEPIATVYLHDERLHLPFPMLALAAGPTAPAQFVFDLGALGRAEQLFAFVVSGAAPFLEHGLAALSEAVLLQAKQAFAGSFQSSPSLAVRHVAAERRATFSCTPELRRPPMSIAPGLHAAGDYVDGPYPATLEGAVRSGQASMDGLLPVS
jgi:squalene-associated FAD-dependent desaturase